MAYPNSPGAEPVGRLIEQFDKLPGIGPKMAQRLAYHLVRMPEESARSLADALIAVKERIVLCSICFNITEQDPCRICSDPARDQSRICVVEEALDVMALERTGVYRGLFHVLHGAISPMNGIYPGDLKIEPLLSRLRDGVVEEVVLATNPNMEGDATSMYIHNLLAPTGIRVTRPASGLPVGGDLEYADEVTLGRAWKGARTSEQRYRCPFPRGHPCTTRHSGESRNPGPSEQRSHLAEAGLSPSPQPSSVKRPLRNRRSREEPAPYSIRGRPVQIRHSGESRNPGPSEQRSHLAEAGLSPSPQPSSVKRPLRNRSREEPAPYSIRGRPVQIRHSGESRNPGGGGPAWIASFRSPMLLCSESYAKVSEGGNPGLRWSASTMLIHCHDFTLSP